MSLGSNSININLLSVNIENNNVQMMIRFKNKN